MGGGLAGLTLAIQLKEARPETTVRVIEKRVGAAPDAAFKVGESTTESGAYYLSDVVGMKDHIHQHQLRKAGLRIFFPSGDNADITSRNEMGTRRGGHTPTFQIDRGRFENALAERARALGAEILSAAVVDGVEIGDPHVVSIVSRDPGGERSTVAARWLVDAGGRSAILRSKLGLTQEVEHTIDAAWFRLGGGIDVEDWSDDEEWLGRVPERGHRRLATNHLMDEGYWIWIIPLATGPSSVGIVADPRIHPFDTYNTFEKALEWLRAHEPQLAADVEAKRDTLQDFLSIENFSYTTERVISPERWALTGEAAGFADPLYSVGSDVIAFANTLITHVVQGDLDGEDVSGRIEGHNRQVLVTIDNLLKLYTGLYPVLGNAQVMTAKILWDNAYFWSYPALWFFNGKLTDREFREATAEDFTRGLELHWRMQRFFREWHERAPRRGGAPGFLPVDELGSFWQRHLDLQRDDFSEQELRERQRLNADYLEGLGVLMFHEALGDLPDLTVDEDARINPRGITLRSEAWEEEGLFDESGLTLAEARERVPDVAPMAFEPFRSAAEHTQ
jgi:flavin-dependent dehydrogenase